jgi:hypothetical protein
MIDDLDEFDDEPLPVLDADGEAIAEPERKRRRPRQRPPTNTAVGDVRFARDATIREATGETRPEPDEWREQQAAGERSKAVASLASRRPTHNADSGFGLA